VMGSEWADGFTPDVLEQIIMSAIGAADFKAVELALTVLAGRDPGRAVELYDSMQVAIALARRGSSDA
jgi:hypothetical protein